MQATPMTEHDEAPSGGSRPRERITKPISRADTSAQAVVSREQIGSAGTPARALPIGTITFLFTDVEGSTRLWERLPDAANRALMRHDALIEACVAQHDGVVVRPRGEGDGRFAVFDQATDAVAGAVAIQRALAAERWPTPSPLRVRMALHTGEADLRAGDYYGSAVNRCARLRSIAHGGQTLLSGTTVDLVRDELPAGLQLRDLGEHRLKDLSRPERVFQLVVPGLPDDFPPLTSLNERRTNLPIQPTLLVGRDYEVKAAAAFLRGETRLLTLTGPGGVGKTRLSLQVGAELLDDFADGVYVVNLSAVSDPALVPTTIAQTLRVVESDAQPPLETLKRWLKDRHILLILDNFEQILTAAPQVAELLTAAPRLKMLITSRAVLHIYGEQEFQVPPLALPDRRKQAPIEALIQNESVALFVARAREVRSSFQLTVENAPAVVKICHRLEGLPLAIELAAARSKLFAPKELLAQLSSSRLKLLSGGAQNLPPRQQALRTAIAWSYNLLDMTERQLFMRLGVFAGGATLEAAEAVASELKIENEELRKGHDADQSSMFNSQFSILDGLASLVDKSLLRQDESTSGESRFVMLETIREFALEQLQASAAAETLRQRHAGYYLLLAEQAEPELIGSLQEVWLDRLESEHDNLRAALQWALNREAVEAAMRIAGAIWRFWYTRGYLSEGRRWLESVLALVDTLPDVDDTSVVRALPFGLALPPASRIEVWAKALTGAGGLAWAQGEYRPAQSYYADALSLYRELKDRPGIAQVLNNQGMVALHQEQYARAEAFYTQSLALFRMLNHTWGTANTLGNLGMVAQLQGDDAQAQRFYTESLAVRRQLRDKRGISLMLNNLGEVTLNQGDTVQSFAFYVECLALCRELHDREGAAYCLEGLAGIAVARRQIERAAQLWGIAEGLREAIGSPLMPADRTRYDRLVAEARAQADPAAWQSAWEAGRQTRLDQAVIFASTRDV
jgi:predicted ATPase/class 3 adenylate cyclase